VICPGFSADCLETIEEIGEENREYFIEAGGERYEYIPCLNDQEMHIEFLADLVSERLVPWIAKTTAKDSTPSNMPKNDAKMTANSPDEPTGHESAAANSANPETNCSKRDHTPDARTAA
ncbi:MAG: ferrochelatase, partial [Pseudomonadota bacterium]